MNEYKTLKRIQEEAFKQASEGKGKDRHANDLPFEKQPMMTITRAVGVGFPLGQAMKKIQESMGLPYPRNKAELLGAINYISGGVLYYDECGDSGVKVQADNDKRRHIDTKKAKTDTPQRAKNTPLICPECQKPKGKVSEFMQGEGYPEYICPEHYLRKGTIKDGCGNEWSNICPECNKKTMQVIRPGKVQCRECG